MFAINFELWKEKIGLTEVDLIATKETTWNQETNVANMVADLTNYIAESEVTII